MTNESDLNTSRLQGKNVFSYLPSRHSPVSSSLLSTAFTFFARRFHPSSVSAEKMKAWLRTGLKFEYLD
ncbi:hypothetical protein E2C01_090319 [Portunus trituberculatus]|uniref:Uncharacterized protein n=1 Tax=Portunus trituberculatus TaxID=210409 RepID=A0A5B7JL25_PORTR|nr:hypothetical protein [Portunus trituberculatus]